MSTKKVVLRRAMQLVAFKLAVNVALCDEAFRHWLTHLSYTLPASLQIGVQSH